MSNIIGRKSEIKILKDALKSKHAELIAIYGRRRIGKTFLISLIYKSYIKFEISGIYKIPLKDQLQNFHLLLKAKYKKANEPKSWIEAFHELTKYFDKLKSKTKKVIFIDEFPWLDSRKSNFLPAFENFWNTYASKRSDIIIVICGSAASYMIKKIINSKRGLHNRLTQKINLNPFNLHETEKLLKYNKVNLSRYDILQLYMTTGGIPHYLNKIKPGESVAQSIDRLCFTKNGFLRSEFKNIFASLFDQYENHETIVRTLANVRKGLTRNEILKKSKITTGGTLTKTLRELEDSGFIENYTPYQGTKNALFRLTDEYSNFYIKYIEKTKPSKQSFWMKMQSQQSYKSWAGFCFETICIKHVDNIITALQIAGIRTTYGSWKGTNKHGGAQIDLLIDRDDNVINLCEIKFYNTAYSLDKKYALEVTNKINQFTRSNKTNKSIFTTFITTFGVKENKYSQQLIQNEVTMDDLFEDL